jgi:hypothetical protein
MNSDRIFVPSSEYACRVAEYDALNSAPRVELPHFNGTNSMLWQRRCEEYFHIWETPACHWISYASSQFTGTVATWLEAFLTKFPQAERTEFVQAVMLIS